MLFFWSIGIFLIGCIAGFIAARIREVVAAWRAYRSKQMGYGIDRWLRTRNIYLRP